MTFTKEGKAEAIVDGFWIITLGLGGSVALVTLLVMMLQPIVLTMRRFPAKTWSDPEVGPAVVLAMLLLLMMFDFLSNAMLNPIYALAMGAVVGVTPTHAGRRRREAETSLADASALMGEGHLAEAGAEFRRAIDRVWDRDDHESLRILAEALDGLGLSLLTTGDLHGAEEALREALAVRDRLAAEDNDPGRFRDLAIARESLSRALVEVGRPAEAIEERRIALQIWDILTANHPKKSEFRDHRIDALNDLSWLLSTDPDPALHDPPRALQLAEEAVRASGGRVAFWNTLGVARYRAGDWAGAIEALERSAAEGPGGGTAFDYFFLAMACRRLDDAARAREWLEQGMAWAARHRPGHPALERFRREAETLLGDPGPGRDLVIFPAKV
jgi:tetratricopeptide (TPR) repeat protein